MKKYSLRIVTPDNRICLINTDNKRDLYKIIHANNRALRITLETDLEDREIKLIEDKLKKEKISSYKLLNLKEGY